ncbi:MAG: choice-of-anchor Q domain-containing protein [Saprospiraceae bacterium]
MKYLFATLLFLAAFTAQTSAAIWYVNPNGSDANTGDSWGAAFQNVQTAISASTDGDEIWVAEGTYLPTLMWAGNTNRHRTFFVNFDVKLFGGFTGAETMRDQRDWVAHPTILSGDLGVQDNFSDNAYHVVWINGRSSAMELDGFTITKGMCDGLNSNVNDRGAGIYNTAENYNSTPTIRNCTVTGNFGGSFGYGAGMYNYGAHDASATLTDCTFFGNAETEDGGAMYNYAASQGIASPVLTNCAFTNNSAGYGGAVANKAEYGGVCAPVLTNCTFNNNYALVNGGAMFNWDNISAPVLNNCTFSTNSAGNQGGAIFHQAEILTLNNCSLNNNTAENGGGLLVLAGGVLATDCTFSGNTATMTSGGAVDIWGFPSEAFTFLRCTFSDNSATNGGAVSLDIDYTLTLEALFDRCTFSGNSATNGGALYTAGSHDAGTLNVTLLNCRLFDNTAGERGGAFCSGGNYGSGFSKMYHCTFYNNTATLGGGAVGTSNYIANQPTPSLHNCIAWNNSSTFGQTVNGQGGVLIQYSLIQESGCPTGAGCGVSLYNLDPLFINVAAHDFHLQSNSPAKNTGANVPVTQDFDGTSRPQGPAFDMGAFEVPVVCPPGPVVFVDKDATSGADNGTSWGDAFVHLQDALDAAADCPGTVEEIWVAEGTYLPTAMWAGNTDRHKTFFVNHDVKIFGGFDGTEILRDERDWVAHPTILSGDLGVANNMADNTYHVVWIEGRSSAMELDGFTITKGKLHHSDQIHSWGAGIYNNADHQASTPTIRNCTITGNEGNTNTRGAGMFNKGYFGDASPTMTDCTFSNNTVPGNSNGGAMYNYAFGPTGIASPVMTDCAFTNNYAAFRGGVLYNSVENSGTCAPVLTDCTFTGNTTTYQSGGAIYHVGQELTLDNCTFTNNSAFIGGAIGVTQGFVTATDCSFLGNSAPANSGAVSISGADVTSTFTRCTFSNNSTPAKGGAVTVYSSFGSTLVVAFDRCTFSNNSAANGGAVYTSGISDANLIVTLYNCRLFGNTATGRGGALCSGRNDGLGYTLCVNSTFYNNTAPQGGGGAMGTLDVRPNQAVPALINCIAWGNSSTFGQTAGGQGGLSIEFSLIQEAACPTGATCGNGMIYNKNPLFVNAAANNFHLQACSPAVDMADMGYSPAIDFDNMARPQNGGYDMGAFEYVGVPCLPEAKCKNSTVNLSAAGTVSVPAGSIDNGSTGCELQFQINNQSAHIYTCANVGANVATLTVTDCNNNTDDCTATVTVVDNIAPTITCPGPVSVSCTGNAPVNLASVTANDNCGSPAKSHVGDVSSNQTCVNRKTITRTYRATDGSGNSITCAQIITVYDDVKPNFSSLPANVTVQCNSVPAAGSPAASDGCGGTVTIAYNGQTTVPGACLDAYTITRQWTATDACGNTKTATQRITVVDTQKPNFTGTPANITVQCSAIPNPATPTATDNCDAVVAITYNGQTTTAGTCANAYTLTRTWTATDNCGNTRTITQRIAVVDNGKPVFTSFPENTTITCNETPPAVGNPTASDGCGNTTVTYLGQSSTGGSCPGNHQLKRTWRATDACGNSTVATQTIQVSDVGAPEFTSVPGPLTIECTDPLPPLVNPTATDACSGYVHITFLGNAASGSGCSADYIITRTWRADDLCGNTATTTQVVTVLGNNYGEEGTENRDAIRQPTEDGRPLVSSIRVHPNPTTDRVWLDLTDYAGEAITVSIFSDLGQLIWENRIPAVEDLKMSVSLLEAGAKAGMYTVSVNSACGVMAKRMVLVE